jgi:hypothetical protein
MKSLKLLKFERSMMTIKTINEARASSFTSYRYGGSIHIRRSIGVTSELLRQSCRGSATGYNWLRPATVLMIWDDFELLVNVLLPTAMYDS